MTYRLQGRIVAVGIADLAEDALSTVYFFFDTEHQRRGLGTYSILCEIQWARERGLSYYYLGYHVRDCPKMSYKARFRPHERLGPHGLWRGADEPP